MECVICSERDGELTVVNKGIEKIKEYSEIRGDDVYTRVEESEVVYVHEKCRKNYTRRPPVNKHEASTSTERTHRTGSLFNFKKFCFLCGDIAKFDERNPNNNISQVRTLGILGTIRLHANVRNDVWGRDVTLRLDGVIDLVAAEGRYHRNCYTNFLRPNLQIPGTSCKSSGRPPHSKKNESFLKLCEYIEDSEDCQFSINELINTLKKMDPASDPFSEKHLKRKLKQFFGDSVVFTELPGRPSVVCFSGYRDAILTEKWYEAKKSNEIDERNRIVIMAAKIIREDIRSRAYNLEMYPTTEEMVSGGREFVPESLSLFIDEIVVPKTSDKNKTTFLRKSMTIQHCIVGAARPRSFVSPIHIGLSIHLHRQFGSKLLIDILSNLGVCSSYKETLKYEAAATITSSTAIEKPNYVQYIFDNADYNIRTLDGYGSFHVMGGVQTITPHSALQKQRDVPRNLPTENLAVLGTLAYIPMVWYKQPFVSGLSQITAIDLSDVSIQVEPESATNLRLLDILWAAVFTSTSSTIINKPGWNGFMEASHKHLCSNKSALVPLPFINHDPNNQSTVYTAMVYAAKESEKLDQKKVFVTFDQPLCHKAFDILCAASPDSVLSRVEIRIGGLHLLMSFLGAIGMVMGGCGLEDKWNTIYAKNTVIHMLSGRQYARAIRAHLLTHQALLSIIFEMCPEREQIVYSLEDTFTDILEGNLLPDSVGECRDVQTAFTAIASKIMELSNASRTAKLWAQYIEMIELVHLYIAAERSGDWQLHLFCVQSMLPYFHAAGHLNYAKTAHIYLQRMIALKEYLQPEELNKFVGESYFTIRRTDKFWSGTWTDMVIEQYLMRSMKTTGGLTHGRGLSSSTLAKLIKTMPATVEVVDAIEKMAGVYSATTNQHVELREARKSRDNNDALRLQEWLKLHNPFRTESTLLVCVTNGLIASSQVNCDCAKEIGVKAMKGMVGKQFSNIHLKRKDTVTTYSKANQGIKVRENVVHVNSSQLFHRMVCVVRSDDELKENLKYELSAWPPALFENCSLRKGSGKAALLPVLEKDLDVNLDLPDEPVNTAYTVDGGYLLHVCPWQRHETYGEIVKKYVSFVVNRYTSPDITVVFDGYGKPSTKDHEHSRRGFSSEVLVEENSFAAMHSDMFLANPKNKIQLIHLLSTHLQESGIHVVQAEADADTLLVSNTVSKGNLGKTSILVGEDTDLVVLLAANSEGNTYMLIPSKGKRPRKLFKIAQIQEALGPMKDYLLFIHAFSGCDTTSFVHGKGKSLPFEKLKQREFLKEKVAVFNDKCSTPEAIANAGEAFMCVLYGAKVTDRLHELRYKMYLRTVTKQKLDGSFKLSLLPPTFEATKQHSFRVFHQIQSWKNCEMEPSDWGWKLQDGQYSPIPTLMDPAPQRLLCLVSCNCKTGCERRNCECLKNSLKCNDMCGYCSGFGCSNRVQSMEEDETMEDLQD